MGLRIAVVAIGENPLIKDRMHDRQVQVETYSAVLPATIQGLRRYLGSG